MTRLAMVIETFAVGFLMRYQSWLRPEHIQARKKIKVSYLSNHKTLAKVFRGACFVLPLRYLRSFESHPSRRAGLAWALFNAMDCRLKIGQIG